MFYTAERSAMAKQPKLKHTSIVGLSGITDPSEQEPQICYKPGKTRLESGKMHVVGN